MPNGTTAVVRRETRLTASYQSRVRPLEWGVDWTAPGPSRRLRPGAQPAILALPRALTTA